jgi:hypothetical protein
MGILITPQWTNDPSMPAGADDRKFAGKVDEGLENHLLRAGGGKAGAAASGGS